jgi:hypothetical protein
MEFRVCKNKKIPVGDLYLDIMQIVKDNKLIVTAHASMFVPYKILLD